MKLWLLIIITFQIGLSPVFGYVTLVKPENFVQWAVKNSEGPDINITRVWEEGLLERLPGEVIVAVLDTGADYLHEDLRDNMWINEVERDGVEGIDDDGNGFVDDIRGYDFAFQDADPMDGTFSRLFGDHLTHGTIVTGLIAASHNDLGIDGVGAGKVKVMPLKVGNVLFSVGSYEKKIVPAIKYAVKMGAKVINLSSGGPTFSPHLKKAIKEAGEAGVLVVTAAGNSDSSETNHNNDEFMIYPANFDLDNIVSVGAIDKYGDLASFSHYGKKTVDILAPGKDILSLACSLKNSGRWREGAPIMIRSQEGTYTVVSGTSSSAPLVSAAAALLFLKYPDLTPHQVRKHLMKTAVRSGKLEKYTASGYLDIYSLLTEPVESL